MPDPVIQVEDLTKSFRSGDTTITVIDHLAFTVGAGEFVAVLGPSGSGKSTLLGLLAGLDRPTAGRVVVEGRSLGELDEDALALFRRHRVGFVFQSFQLLGNLTALENVLLPLELVDAADPVGRAADLLAAVERGGRGRLDPGQLSGGGQQRGGLARAFATEPPILLADEPTGNLDRATGATVLAVLDELRRRRRTTMVLVTHDAMIGDRADRRIFLRDGRIERVEGSA